MLTQFKYYIFLFTFVCLSLFAGQGYTQTNPVDTTMQRYNREVLRLFRQNKFDECIPIIQQALKVKEDPTFYFYLCHIYTIQNEWDYAITAGEKSLQLNPGMTMVYQDLMWSYIRNEDWSKAKEFGAKIPDKDKNKDMASNIAYADIGLEWQSRSRFIVFLLMIALGAAFFIPVFKNSGPEDSFFSSSRSVRVSEVLLVATGITCVLYNLFFAFRHQIWSRNEHVSPDLVAYNMLGSTFEHDGSESFLLYLISFASIFGTLVMAPIINWLRGNKNLYLAVFTLLYLFAGYYFFSIGFNPSLNAVDNQFLVPVAITAISAALYWLYDKNKWIPRIVVLAFAAWASLVSLAPTSLIDIKYILAPSLRLLHGFKPTEIYFQYDLFLSYLGLWWMKLHLPIEYFSYLGQISYLLFFFGAFVFAEKFFLNKSLSVLFLVALVIMRVYSISFDLPTIFQVTPLRLDLWIILILVANAKGVHHWSVGLVLGLLVLFHRNLGLIYLASYFELLAVLFVIDVAKLLAAKTLNGKTFVALLVKHFRTDILNIGIAVLSVALCYILFKELFSQSAIDYRKIGIGMLRISTSSFDWYMPLVLSCLSAMLLYFRNRLEERYIQVSLLVVLLVIGNSMYFFGRSHENNILNISGILVFPFFMLFDLLLAEVKGRRAIAPKMAAAMALPQNTPTHAAPVANKAGTPKTAPKTQPSKAQTTGKDKTPHKTTTDDRKPINFLLLSRVALPVLFVFLSCYFYSQKITDKIGVEYNNFLESNIYQPFQFQYMDTVSIKKITDNSRKVYFLEPDYDFYLYYYGNYTPLGYYSPMAAWMYKNDMLKYVQTLIDDHYYVVYIYQNGAVNSEYINHLEYNKIEKSGMYASISKEDVPQLLTDKPKPLYHVAFKDTLPAAGIAHAGTLAIGDSFTIQVVVKPTATQNQNAAIVNNMNRVNELEGFTIQSSNSAPGKYVFAFYNGTNNVPNVTFDIEAGKWNDIAVLANKQTIKIYNNGKLIASGPGGGYPVDSSEAPLFIGNSTDGKAAFTGEIREVSISNGNIDENEIISTGQAIDRQLNGVSPSQP